MKKILISAIATSFLATSFLNANECPSQEEKLGFGLVGIAQGAIIGGPVGAFWAIGTLSYADNIKCDDNAQEKVEETKESKAKTVKYEGIVNFDFDSYKVKSIPSKLQALSNDNTTSISIDGHTDEIGTDEYNFALGLKRANEVKNILVLQGVDKSKLSVKSYGETAPISKDDSKNRRVDLTVSFK